MSKLVSLVFGICQLKLGPQNMPYTFALWRMGLVLWLVSSVLGMLLRLNWQHALLSALAELLTIMVLLAFFLMIFSKKGRFMKTMTSLLFVGVFFNVLRIPFVLILNFEISAFVQVLMEVGLLLLHGWKLAVLTHVLKNALDTSQAMAILLSILYFLLSLFVVGLAVSF